MDDIVVFGKPEHLQQFAAYMTKQHPNIIFEVAAENNGAFPFLDIKIYRENEMFATSVYRKKLSVVCIQILPVSFLLNRSLAYNLCHWSFYLF